jgi:(S)-citramalyl-CoA lyase
VRINDASTPWHDDDLKACRGKPGVAGILLPKAESLAQVRHVVQAGLSVIPILETAQGILNAGEVAATPGVARLAFGSLDYGLDMGLTPDTPGAETVLDQARVQVLLHSRAAGLAPALDGVFPGVQDQAGLAQAAGRAQQMGFGGMLCIHPAQVAVIHAAFVPAQEELEWARRVVAAHRDTAAGTFMLDGKMVDAPVIARARLVLAQAGESAGA